MISGKLELDQSLLDTTFTDPVTPCQEAESLLSLLPQGLGLRYSDDGSWLGIKSAALCTGGDSSLPAEGGILAQLRASARAGDGLGLVVEIDLSRLPGGSLDGCSLSIDQEYRTKFPLVVYVKRIGAIGDRGFISVLRQKELNSASVYLPRGENIYNIQGICAK